MKTSFKRWTALLTLLVLIASLIYLPAPVDVKAYEFYGDYTDVAVIKNASSSIPSMQGLAVGSQMLYSIKIATDDSAAHIFMTDKDSGETTQLYSADSGSYLFYNLYHANDMDVWGIDGASHLFVTSTEKGNGAIIRYKRSGSTLTKVASYRLQCNGADICATAMAVKGYSNGKITFITKWGLDVYMGSVDASLSQATINMTKICTLVKSQAYIKDTYNDLTNYVNQGFGYHDGTIFLPISGDDSNLNRSVILVFNIDDAIAANSYTGLVYPVEHLAFRVTSGAYSALFEIESCDICSADGKLYFNTNRRVTDNDTNWDGVSVFDGYTYTKVSSEAKHFTIKYMPNGGTGSMDDTRVPIGYSTPTRANAFTRNGYEFAGWTAHRTTQDYWYYTNGTSSGWYAEGSQPSGYYLYTYKSGNSVSATSSIDGDVVEFYAQWTPLDKTYTIKYHANGGTGTMADTTVVYGYSTNISKNTFTRPGYKFVGWTAHRTSQNQWYYTNGTDSGWYAEGSQPSGYTLELYNDGVSVAKTTAVDGDVVNFYAQWERVSGYDYQLVGYINGADHGCEADASNPGNYKFVNGKLVATFTQDSYVFVKTSDNGDWFMAKSYITGTSGTLYSTSTGAAEKMLVPGNREITFTLKENSDGTLSLSYTAVCKHSYTSKVTTAATCTKTGVRTYTCSICGDTYTETIAKSAHSYTSKVTKPTCSTNGYTTYTCTVCGYSYTGNEVSTTGHSYGDGVITKKPTCTVTGVQTFTCSVCGDSYQKSIYATGHTYVSVVTAPTCTNNGYTTYTCKSCGDSYQADTVLALGHDYDDVVTKPTCTEAGYTTYTCTTCGYSYVGNATAAVGHAYAEGICIDCGALDPSYVVTDTGFVLVTDLSKITDGSYVLVAQIDGVYRALGTSLSSGKILGVDVNVSGRVVTGSDLPVWKFTGVTGGFALRNGENYLAYNSSTNFSLGTSAYAWSITAGNNGFIFNSASTNRGIYYQITSGKFGAYATSNVNSSSYVSNLLVFKYQVGTQGCSHVYVTSIKEATCTASGTKTHTCDLCGYTYNETIPATGHSYTSKVTAPTCTVKGYTTYTCSDCGYSYVGNQVNALGHNYKVTTVNATCTVNGSKTHTCTNCGDVVKETISATGHSYKTVVTAPTCDKAGYTTYTCSTCGDSYTANPVAALGHSYKTVTVNATCTVDGSVTKTCSNCGNVVKETIPATGHSYQNVVTAPTCIDAGYTTYICICGHSYVGNPVAALGHNYVGGACGTCGAKDPDYSQIITPNVTLKNPTLAFEDEILYNVYYNVDNTSSITEMGMITFDTRNENGTVVNAKEVVPGYVKNTDGTYTVHSNGIPAKLLSDTLYFKVYAKLTDGSYVYSNMAGYHAVAYANTILNSSASSAKAKSLVVAMLNYGAAAQTNFGYKTDALMNASLTSAQKALVSGYSESMIAAVPSISTTKAGSFVMNGGYTNIHPTVSFEGAFSINYYFTPKFTSDSGTVTFYYWNISDFNSASVLTAGNATGTVKMTSSNGVYTTAIEGIAAKAIDEPVFIAAMYTNGGTNYYTPVIGYSLGNYCKNIATNGNAFGAATAVYGFYAKAFFAN